MRKMREEFSAIYRLIDKSETICIAGHTNPDGDAIGACLALARSLKKIGKQVWVMLEPYAPKYDIIAGKELISAPEQTQQIDLFISLDCSDTLRLADAYAVLQRASHSCQLDHHRSNEMFAEVNHVEAEASSTCEVLYQMMEGYLPIDREIATALYAGLVYDTGGFRHSSTAPSTMEAAARLMAFDIPFTAVYERFFSEKTYSETKILGKAIENAALYFDGKCICSTITAEEIAACGGNNKELDTVINVLNGVIGTEIACFLYEKTPRETKASLRGKDGRDVCALAQLFGGGGHVKAAGCTIHAPVEQAKEKILSEIEKLFLHEGGCP